MVVSTQMLYMLGAALVGWVVRHYSMPKVAVPGTPAIPVPSNPFAQTHPVLSVLFQQGEGVVNQALHDWLANGMAPSPLLQLPAPASPVATGADQHPLVNAASQVASQAGQVTAQQVMANILQALQSATPATIPAPTVAK